MYVCSYVYGFIKQGESKPLRFWFHFNYTTLDQRASCGSDFNTWQHVTPDSLYVTCSSFGVIYLRANNLTPLPAPLAYTLRVWPTLRQDSNCSCKSKKDFTFLPLYTCILVNWQSLCKRQRYRGFTWDERYQSALIYIGQIHFLQHLKSRNHFP